MQDKLEQIATVRSGYSFRQSIKLVKNSGIYAIQMRDISMSGEINFSSCVETELTGKREPDWLNVNDILFVARGNHNYAVRVDEEFVGRKVVAAAHFLVIEPNLKRIDAQFLTWWINEKPSQDYFDRASEGSSTRNIRLPILRELMVPLISLEEQRKIVQFHETIREEEKIFTTIMRNNSQLSEEIATSLFSKSVNGK